MAAIHFKCALGCERCHGAGFVSITHRTDEPGVLEVIVTLCDCAQYYRMAPR